MDRGLEEGTRAIVSGVAWSENVCWFLSKNSYHDVQLLGEKLLLLSILQVVLPGSKQGKETTKMSMYLLNQAVSYLGIMVRTCCRIR